MVQTTYKVTTESALDAAIAAIDEGGTSAAQNTAYTIDIEASFSLSSDPLAINLLSGSSVAIEGTESDGTNSANQTLNGAGQYRGFFVYDGAVTLEDLILADTSAKGGTGGVSGGGGGAGLGGGLFVAGTTQGSAGGHVTLENVSFTGDSATGGNGGAGEDQGYMAAEAALGGGLGGNGQSGVPIPGVGTFGAGGADAGGPSAGAGEFGGGGAGGGPGSGGAGGFGGGGGAVTGGSSGYAGHGGYGAGNGGSYSGAGGGGLGAGGDIFVQQGGSLTVIDSNLAAGTVHGGAAGTTETPAFGPYGMAGAGSAQGSSIFLQGTQVDTLETAGVGQTLTVGGTIADDGGQGALIIAGQGTVTLNGANSSYGGGTTIGKGATLSLGAPGAAGSGPITFASGGSAALVIGKGDVPTNALDDFAPTDVIDLQGIGTATGQQTGANNTVVITGGSSAVTLGLDPYNVYSFAPDGHGGTDLTVAGPQVFSVASASDFANAITTIDNDAPSGNGFTIVLARSFTLSSDLPILNNATGGLVTIDGEGYTINGGGLYAGLIVQSGTVTLLNLTIAGTIAEGGAGGYGGGGGGAGLGGGLFVGSAANVTLQNVNLTGDSAVGGTTITQGSQDDGGGGGGGGLDGGQGGNAGQGGGGGGGIGTGAIGGTGDVNTGTYTSVSIGVIGHYQGIPLLYPVPNEYESFGFPYSPGNGIAYRQASAGGGGEYDVHNYISVYTIVDGYQTIEVNTDTNEGQGGGSAGGGGGAGAGGAGGGGGGIGGGNSGSVNNTSEQDSSGANGGWGGGGGGGSGDQTGGAGGFGGGGGGGGNEVPDATHGGAGGYGGGGGRGSSPGKGGFGAGNGNSEQGGGGLGAGGGVFVQSGGKLTIDSGALSGDSVQGGIGAQNGMGLGADVFFAGSGTLAFAPAAGQSVKNLDGIADEDGSVPSVTAGKVGVSINGAGTVVLGGKNTYTGGTTLTAGTLELVSGGTLGGTITAATGTTIEMDAGSTFTGTINLTGSTYTVLAIASGANFTGTISVGASTALLLQGLQSAGNLIAAPSSTGVLTLATTTGTVTLHLSGVNAQNRYTLSNTPSGVQLTLLTAAATNVSVGTGADLQSILTWLAPGGGASSASAANFGISLATPSFTLSGAVAATLPAGDTVTLSAPTATTLSGGSLSLGNGTLVLSAALPLTVASTLTGAMTVSIEGKVTLSGANTFTGPLVVTNGATLTLANGAAAGTGRIEFGGSSGTLVLNPASLPTVPIGPANPSGTGNQLLGDVIDLQGVIASGASAASAANHTVTVPLTGGGSAVLQFDSTLASGTPFVLRSDGQGGTDVIEVNNQFVIAAAADLATDVAAISTGGPDALPGATEDFTVSGTVAATGPLPALQLPAAAQLVLEGSGTLTMPANGLEIAAGTVVLDGPALVAGTGPALTVDSGATLDLTAGSITGGVSLAAGGTADITPSNGGSLSVATSFSGAGGLVIGAGSVTLSGASSFTGGITLGGSGVLDATSAASLGSGAITFASLKGTTLRVEGSAAPANAISLPAGSADVIDLTGIGGSARVATLNAQGQLAVATGVTLDFTGLPVGTPFVLLPDGSGGTDISLAQQQVAVADSAGLSAAIAEANALPSFASLTFDIVLPAGLLTVSSSPPAQASTATNVVITDNAPGAPSSLALTAGVSLSLAGTNTYSGGTSIGAGASLVLGTAAAAGTGPISFASAAADLTVANGVPTQTLDGFAVGDLITLSGVSAPAQRLLSNAVGVLTIPLTGGTATLQFGPGLGDQLFGVTQDGNGIEITEVPTQFTVTTGSALQAAISAISGTGSSAAPNVPYTITLGANLTAGTLPELALDPGATLALNGAGDAVVMPASGLTVASGSTVTIQNVTLAGTGTSLDLLAGSNVTLLSGTYDGAVEIGQSATAAPAVGTTLSLVGGVAGAGTLTLGNGSGAAGGTTIVSGTGSLAGGVVVPAGQTLVITPGASVGGPIDVGTQGVLSATVRLQGTNLSADQVVLTATQAVVDLPNISLPAPAIAIVSAQSQLAVGATELNVVAPAGTFILESSDGAGGTKLTNVNTVATASNQAQFDAAIAAADALPAVAGLTYTINLVPGTVIDLTGDLTALDPAAGITVNINGNGSTIDGGATYGGIFALTGPINITGLTIQNTVAQGGNGAIGSSGGGGGAGLGGAVFVGSAAQVTLSNVTLTANSAVGGNPGGVQYYGYYVGGGGGGLDGGSGGGGGSNQGAGGSGAFGGGGAAGGSGGFGGAAGGAALTVSGYGSPGFGGGDSNGFVGGGGLGAGGAIFVEAGGSLTVNSGVSQSGGSVAGGSGANAPGAGTYVAGDGGMGMALGAAVFVQGSSTLSFAPAANTTDRIANTIQDMASVGGVGLISVSVSGLGTVEFDGANQYGGPTTITAGSSLLLTGSTAGLTGATTDNGTLTFQQAAGGSYGQAIGGTGALILDDGGSLSLTGALSTASITAEGASAATLSGVVTTGTLTQAGAGTLTLSGPINATTVLAQGTGALNMTGGLTTATLQQTGGSVDVSGSFNVTGSTTLSAGTLTLSGALTSQTKITDNATLSFAQSGSASYAGAISGAGSVVVSVGGTLALSGSNSFSGGVLLNSGALSLRNANAAGTGAIQFAPGSNATLVVNPGMPITNTIEGFAAGDTIDFAGIGLASQVSLSSSGLLSVTSGAITESVQLDPATTMMAAGAAPAITSDKQGGTRIQFTTATQTVANAAALAAALNTISTNGESGVAYKIDLAAGFTGSSVPLQPFTVPPTDTLLVTSDAPATPTPAGLDIASGALSLDGVTLLSEAGTSSQIPALVEGAGVTVTLDSASILNASGSAPGILLGNGAVLAADPLAGQTDTIGAPIAQSAGTTGGALVVNGQGTLALTTASSFTGGVTLQSGTLSLQMRGAAGTGPITFAPGANATLAIASGAVPGSGPPLLTNVIDGFGYGETIDVAYAAGLLPLGAGNVLTLTGGSINRTLSFDPSQSFAGSTFTETPDGAGGVRLTLQPTSFVVTSAAGLIAAIQAIDADQGAAPSNTAYSITFAANITGLAQNLPAVSLASGSTLTVNGNGYALTGNGVAHGFSVQSGVVAIGGLTLSDLGAPGDKGGAIAAGSGASVTLSADIIQGGSGSAGAGSGVLLGPGDTLTFSPAAGAQTVVSDAIVAQPGAASTLLMNGAGRLVLDAANTLTGPITIASGTVELAAPGAAGSAAITFTDNGVLQIDSGVTAGTVNGLVPNQGSIDLVGVAPGSLSPMRTANGLSVGGLTLTGLSVAVLASDGNGGTLIYAPTTQFTVTDEASLVAAINQISQGGSQAAPNAAYTITLNVPSGTLPLTAPLPALALPPGATLTLQASGTAPVTIDGGGYYDGLTVGSGTLSLANVSFADTPDDALSLAAGSGPLSVTNGDFGAGATIAVQGQTVTVNATLGQTLTLAAIDSTGSAPTALALPGPGAIVLDQPSSYSGGTIVHGSLELAATGAAGSGDITLGTGTTLVVDSGVTVANEIDGLTDGSGTTIELKGLTGASYQVTGNEITLAASGQTETLTLGSATDMQDLLVTGDVQNTYVSDVPRALASPATTIPASIILPDRHVGDADTTAVAFSAANGGTESLVATLSTAASPFTGGGTATLAAGASTSFPVSLDTSAPGSYATNDTLTYASEAPGRQPVTGSQSTTIQGNVYAYADPTLQVTQVNLGAARVGSTAPTTSISFGNTGGGAYQESLNYTASLTGSGFTLSGPVSGQVAAGQSSSVAVNLPTATAGTVSAQLLLDLISSNTVSQTLGDTALPSQSVQLDGEVFAPAVVSAPSVAFGVVHVGDTAVRSLAVTNAAVGALSDTLSGTVDASSGPFSTSLSLNGLAAGTTADGTVTLDTSTAGTFTGSQSLALNSQDSALPDLAVSQTVQYTATVDQYASAVLEDSDGNVLAYIGKTYTLNLGQLLAPETVSFRLVNPITGQADTLSGNFTVAGSQAFSNSGFGAFTGVSSGSPLDATVGLGSNGGGNVSETITANLFSSNSSGYDGSLGTITLIVEGDVPTTDFTATDESDLDTILAEISQGGSKAAANTAYTITLAPGSGDTIALSQNLTAINLLSGSSLTVAGADANTTIEGNDADQGFAVLSGAVTLQSVTLDGLRAQGGEGGAGTAGGGGGAGLGGAVYVASGASVGLENVTFSDDSAIGGAGGLADEDGASYGGGGGTVTDGGTGTRNAPSGAGGTGPDGTGAGGAGASTDGGVGGNGAFGGGGGAGGDYNTTTKTAEGAAGAGGFGGGGGGTITTPLSGGAGGWGGGRGGADPYGEGGGGGGLGAGADVFAQQGASITITGGAFGAGTVAGGVPQSTTNTQGFEEATSGLAGGNTLFLQGNQTLTLAPPIGQVVSIAGGIADQAGTSGSTTDPEGSLLVAGQGSVRITAASSYTGGTEVSSTLDLAAAGAAGSGVITVDDGGTLLVEAGVTVANLVAGFGTGRTVDAQGIAFATASATLTGTELAISDGTNTLDVTLSGPLLSAYGLVVSEDAAGGTAVTYSTPPAVAAIPAIPTSLAFASEHVGDADTATLAVANDALQGGGGLSGGFTSVSAPFSGAGTVALAPGQQGGLTVSLSTATDGRFTSQAQLGLASTQPASPDQPVVTSPVALSGTVYAYAAPNLSNTLALGAARVGDPALAGTIAVADGSTADPYRETLGITASTTATGLSLTPPATGTAAPGATAQLGVSLATATAGSYADTVALGLTSEAVSGSGLSDTALPGAAVTVTGTIYAAATVSAPSLVTFTPAHVGDVQTQTVTLENTATGAVTDSLVGGFGPVSGDFSGTGSVDLAAGQSGSLTVSLNTTTAGVQNGTATLSLLSEDPLLANAAVTTAPVALSAAVYDYAKTGFQSLGAGVLSGSGSSYTLDLGTITSSTTASFGIVNAVISALADQLAGTISVAGSPDFTNTGLDAFSGLNAGQADTAPTVTVTPLLGGEQSETITVQGTGSDSLGYSGAVPTASLTITADIAQGTYTDPNEIESEADLNAALASFSAGGALAAPDTTYTLTIDPSAGTILLDQAIQSIDLLTGSSLTIDGNGVTLDGQGSQRGFFLADGALTLQDMTLANTLAQGGQGGEGDTSDGGVSASGGGGGAGLGGGLFVAGTAGGGNASATLDDVSFVDTSAVGGAGGNGQVGFGVYGASGGGGGLAGDGGTASEGYSQVGDGGAGIDGIGGGGNSANGTDSSGGYGGGGSGGDPASGSLFGGGGGGGNNGDAASGGVGGGAGGNGTGGGGLAAGGSVFVGPGGSLTIQGGDLAAGSVQGGAAGTDAFGNTQGATAGQSLGSAAFLDTGATLTIAPPSGKTDTLSGSIADETGASALSVGGTGIVVFASGASYDGPIIIQPDATFSLTGDATGQTGSVDDEGTLEFDNPATNGVATSLLATTSLLPTDQEQIFPGYPTFAVGGTGSLADLANDINNNPYAQGMETASYDPGSNTVTITGDTDSYGNQDNPGFVDLTGKLIVSNPDPYDVVLSLPPGPLQPTDVVDIDGTPVTVGGTGELEDLASAIDAANISDVTAAVDPVSGLLTIQSPGSVLTVADGNGTPLETLGILPGVHGSVATEAGTITGAGSVTVDNGNGFTLTVNGTAGWSGTTTIAAGNTLVLAGDVGGLTGAIDDSGVLAFSPPSTLAFAGSIAGTGQVAKEGGGTLVLAGTSTYSGGTLIYGGTLELANGGAAGSGAITFVEPDTTLVIDGSTLPANPIDGFSAGDVIDLAGSRFDLGNTAAVMSGNALVITDTDGQTQTLQLDPTQTFYNDAFQLMQDASGAGTDLVETVACFCPGTRILTISGEVPIEQLAIGDLVLTAKLQVRAIKWIGRRSYRGRFLRANPAALPIRLRAGSLGGGLPRRDLLVSPKHAMLLDGVLIEAQDLVNGTSIVRERDLEEVHYLHLDLGTHELVLAEGAPSESFVDDGSRGLFHNATDYTTLYPDEVPTAAEFCAPRVTSGHVLQSVRKRLEAALRLGRAAAQPRLKERPQLDV